MNNFWTRAITGAMFVAIMVVGIMWNIWSFILLFSLISILGLWEFYSLLREKINISQKIIGTLLGIILLSATCGKYFFQPDIFYSHGFLFLILLFPCLLIVKLFQPLDQFKVFSPIIFGNFYVTLPFCFLLLSYSSSEYWSFENDSRIILGFFILIWSNDTFAYLVGRAIGKTKLFERISPKKTWEGFIGGVICTQGIAYIISIYFIDLPLRDWMIVGGIVSVFGTLGDLVESMFKRSLGVKDSGNILPGHGGILDRFDGVLLSSPFVVMYLMMVR